MTRREAVREYLSGYAPALMGWLAWRAYRRADRKAFDRECAQIRWRETWRPVFPPGR